MEYLSLKKDNEAEIICIHSNAGGMIKIPKSYKNVEMFEGGLLWEVKKIKIKIENQAKMKK